MYKSMHTSYMKHAGQWSHLAIKLFSKDVTIICVKEIIKLNIAMPRAENPDIQQLAKSGKHMPLTKAVQCLLWGFRMSYFNMLHKQLGEKRS